MIHNEDIRRSSAAGHRPGIVIPTYKEPWTATWVDMFYRFSMQLASAGGSGAIARTAVAPLDRVKVRRSPLPCLTTICTKLEADWQLMAVCCLGAQILMQVQAMSILPQAEKYKSALDALRHIPSREGFLVSSSASVCQIT